MKVNVYDERNISQIPALEVLKKLGYIVYKENKQDYVNRNLRDNLYSVLLKPVLREQLNKINSYEYKGEVHKFSDENIEKAIHDIDMALTDGLIKTNEKIYDALLLGRSYQELVSVYDGNKSFNIDFIDFDNIENNVFHAIEEFVVETESGQSRRKPDIVLFVNGIPFGVIECKKASISVNQGISQMIRNQGQNEIPNLFKFIQIVMATNKNDTKYATVGTKDKFWNIWKEDKSAYEHFWYKDVLKKTITGRTPTTQDKNIISLFHPKRVFEIMKYFIIFDRKDKKIARYQQYFAVKEMMHTINQVDKDGNRQSGVIWHTQGSGKSLSMVMLAKYILDDFSEFHPKIMVITDRIELDSQIHKTFSHSRMRASRAATGRDLVELIKDNKADIVTSLVHKFDTASKHQKPIYDRDVFVLVDESHRTQYGELHNQMKKVFPNACYLGFTGTPLMKKEKNTMRKFGKMIHKYTIRDGVNDGTIVPLLYEGRMVDQTINRQAIDKRLEMITRNLNEKQTVLLKQKWAQFENIASSEQRIRLIADDIYVHFNKFYRGNNRTPFNAMLATSSRFDAIRYKEAFDEYGDIKTAVVMSPPDQREGYEEVDQEPKDRVARFYNEMIKGYSDVYSYEEHIKNEFVYGDDIDILIVISKLLTGFDAPRASVLYIDKPLKEHGLLQAVARVNRIYEGKDYGLIIDYRGLVEQLDSALEIYSGSGLENFDEEDIQGALVDVISILGKLRESYTNLINMFKDIKNKIDREAYELSLEDDETRNIFYNNLSHFSKYLGLSLESEHVYQALKTDKLEQYKKDLKFFQELRAAVKLRYSDTIDHKEYEARMRNLMDTYIAAEDVMIVTEPVDILDETNLDLELDKMGSTKAKADLIKTRMVRYIHARYDENPAYYKKFSKRIEEIIEEYRSKRISAAEQYEKFEKALINLRKGYSEVAYPYAINNNPDAQAFYGIINESIDKLYNKDIVMEDSLMEDMMADLSLEITSAIERNVKVDWRDNPEVIKKIESDLLDILFKFQSSHNIKKDFKLYDEITNDIVSIALRRYVG